MASDPNPDFTHEFPPFFCIHSSGSIHRYLTHDHLPPSTDLLTGVTSRDAVFSSSPNLSLRLYLPPSTDSSTKLPLLIYIHGGGFSIESAFSSLYHTYANSLSAATNSIVISIEYRLAPEHPIPTCYTDCYLAINWIRSNSGSDPWLHQHADFNRVYIGGDSAGANIAHDVVDQSKNNKFGFNFTGLILIHPFFGKEGKADPLWSYICPDLGGENEFRLNPLTDIERVGSLACDRVLVCVAGKDFLVNRGKNYYEGLKKSGWKGEVEMMEMAGEEHVFHLFRPECENAKLMMKGIAEWVNSEGSARSRF